MRRIGLIGGLSWSATAAYYEHLNREVQNRLGRNHSADLAIRSLDFAAVLRVSSDRDAVEDILIDAGRDVTGCGAELLAVASLTGHAFASHLYDLPADFVSLVDVVADALTKRDLRSVGVLTTGIAMRDEALMRRLSADGTIRLVAPHRRYHDRLERIIFEELARMRFSEESREFIAEINGELVDEGAEAIILGTTEFSRVAENIVASRPVIDASAVHCRRLVDLALDGKS